MNNHNTDSFSLLGVLHSPQFSEILRDFATRELNAFLWLSLVVVTTLLLRRLFSLFGIWHRARTIPGPPSSSFFGSCKLFSRPNFTFTGGYSVIFLFLFLFFQLRMIHKLMCRSFFLFNYLETVFQL